MPDVKTILISAMVAGLFGCATKINEQLQVGGVESKELYRKGVNSGINRQEDKGRFLDVRRARHMIRSDTRYEPFTRNALNETEQLFKLLPNPKIMIHVYPHLSTRDNAPVPGYTTAVSLYRSDEYALPDELIAQGIDTVDRELTPETQTGEGADEGVDSARPAREGNTLEVRMIQELNRQSSEGG